MNENKQDLLWLFPRIEWLLHKHYHYYRMIHGPIGGPYRGQGRVLSMLKMQPEISQEDLTYLLAMRPQSLEELLAKMEQNGYITRTTSETDRRIIKLTEAGTEAASQGNQQADFNEIFGCLEQEDQTILSEYLSRIIASLEQKMGADQAEAGSDGHQHGRGYHHHGYDCDHHYSHDRGFKGWHDHMDRRYSPHGRCSHPMKGIAPWRAATCSPEKS